LVRNQLIMLAVSMGLLFVGVMMAHAADPADGVKIEVLKEGTGPMPAKGQTVVVHYEGTLQDGKKFDSSVDRGQPFEFQVGVGKVIPGWDQALQKMKVGEKAKITIPPEYGYGARGAGNVIPPNSTLIFDVELLKIK
jgi:peptidylprolyl isomerase